MQARLTKQKTGADREQWAEGGAAVTSEAQRVYVAADVGNVHPLLKGKTPQRHSLRKIRNVDPEKEAVTLTRVVRYVPKDADGLMAMELDPDQGHVDVLLTALGLTDDKVKGAATPRVKRSEDHVVDGPESPLLQMEGATIFWPWTVRLFYLGQDRADIQAATK